MLDLPDFDFAEPGWFALLLAIPLLIGLKFWSRQNSSRGVNALVAKRLQPSLVHRTPAAMDWIQFSLQLVALLLFVTAMARPQWDYESKDTIIEGRNVIIAIDTSRSMLANDLRPDRLSRAKLAAQDLVRNLESDRVGVIAFAGEAFVQAPLTVDHEAVLETIRQIDTEMIPRGGTNLTKPALLALETLAEGETSLGALVIFSDGEDHEGETELAQFKQRALDSNLTVITVGVGTEAGAIIPDPDAEKEGVFLRDENDEIVRSRLNPAALQKLSSMTDGMYLNMGGNSSVSDIVSKALNKLEAHEMAADNRLVPIERYYFPLVAGMVFFVLSFAWPMKPFRTQRIPAAASALIALLIGFGLFQPNAAYSQAEVAAEPEPEPAVSPEEGAKVELTIQELIKIEIASDRRTAIEMFRAGDFVKAQARYEEEIVDAGAMQANRLRLGLGAAAYRSGDLESAKKAYSKVLLSSSRDLQREAHFNLATTLFETGRQLVNGVSNPEPELLEQTREQWQSAMGHYAAALDLDKNDRRTRQNLDVVRQNLELLVDPPPPPPPPEDEEDEEDEEEDEEDEEDENNEDDQNNDDQNQDNDQNPSDPPNNNSDPPPSDPPPGEPPPEQPPEAEPPPEGQPPEAQPPEAQPPEAPPEAQPENGQPPEAQPPGQPPEANPAEANPGEGNPENQAEAQPPPPGQSQPGEMTPSEARQILDANADEDKDAQPAMPMKTFATGGFKNW
ncbi:MAG: Ca-activated chloride channel family protein [Verrucomicrobiales bacterium]|jgi:Ca-activated chloride channel family protein